jgi:hypothetical protein
VQRLWISAALFGLLVVILGAVILLWPGQSIIVAGVLGRLSSTLGLGGEGVEVLGLSRGVPWCSSSPSRGRAACPRGHW